MKFRDSPQLTTSTQCYVTYCTVAFPSCSVSMPTQLVIAHLTQDTCWTMEEEVKRRSHIEMSLLRASAQCKLGTTPHSLCMLNGS